MTPRTQYTKIGNSSIAYRVLGDGPIDLVYAQGWITNVEYAMENPDYARFLRRLGSFSRFIWFDRRGMGISDRDVESLTLEERAEDIRAVMDAVGSEKASLLGVSEGGYMATMFAATHPERTRSLILYGCYAKGGYAPDYPWALKADGYENQWIGELERNWGGPYGLDTGAPSVADNPEASAWFGAYLRYSASLSTAKILAYQDRAVDVRALLPSIRVPTLVLHRTGDQWVNIGNGRYLAQHIPGAILKEMPGEDHLPWWGDQEQLIGEIEEFLTGTRAAPVEDRVLLTVLVTDIVGSTEKAAQLGDTKWKSLLESHDAIVRQELKKFAGQEVNTTGDGFVMAFTGPSKAIRCALSIKNELGRIGLDIRVGEAWHTECDA